MLVRTWCTGVMDARAGEYETFAREVSLPMFRSHPGCHGVVMTRDGEQCRVVTFWASDEAIADLEASARYRETVARILAQGFLTGDQSVTVEKAHTAWLCASET